MKLISNTGTNRVIDCLRESIQTVASLDIATPFLSLFAFAELRELLNQTSHSRLILSIDTGDDLTLLGSAADRPARNRLQAHRLARVCANWIREKPKCDHPQVLCLNQPITSGRQIRSKASSLPETVP